MINQISSQGVFSTGKLMLIYTVEAAQCYLHKH